MIFNVSAGIERNPELIRDLMSYQIASKVRWLEIVQEKSGLERLQGVSREQAVLSDKAFATS